MDWFLCSNWTSKNTKLSYRSPNFLKWFYMTIEVHGKWLIKDKGIYSGWTMHNKQCKKETTIKLSYCVSYSSRNTSGFTQGLMSMSAIYFPTVYFILPKMPLADFQKNMQQCLLYFNNCFVRKKYTSLVYPVSSSNRFCLILNCKLQKVCDSQANLT
jgi:hypothetical protein